MLLAKLRSAFRVFFRSGDLERDLDDELAAYVADLTAQNIAQGFAPEAARRAALVEVGGVEQVKEQVRDGRVGGRLEIALRDLRYGCRMIARAPGFSAVVILTLALVIGANATASA